MNAYHTGTQPIHSGLLTPQTYPSRDSFEIGSSVAFQWDISNGLSPKHSGDLIYSEPAWRHGYNIFHKRAGIVPRVPFNDYMKSMGEIVEAAGKPAFIVAGKDGARLLPHQKIMEINITAHGKKGGAWGYLFNLDIPAGLVETVDILRYLATCHDRVIDFNCGYGCTGRVFKESGKQFAISDLDGACVGFIAAHAGNW